MGETAAKRSRRSRQTTGREKLVTLQQASREYGPPYGSLRALLLNGSLQGVKLSDDARRIWIRRTDLEKLLGV